jgi:hypothetical protein
MKYAWIENDRVRDVCHGDPNECYHPDVAKFYDTQVPDDATNGDGWVGGALVKPEPPPAPTPPPRQWTDSDFRNAMNLIEKTKWDNDLVSEIKTVKAELPAVQAAAQELVDFLVSVNAISADTATKIMA